MADTLRKQILDAAVDALEGITDIGLVSTKLRTWKELQPKDFPALFPIDGDTELEELAFTHATADDMTATMELIVTGYVYDPEDDLTAARTELLSDVETTLVADAALLALIREIRPVRILTDKGTVQNYGIFDFTFEVVYDYNHASP